MNGVFMGGISVLGSVAKAAIAVSMGRTWALSLSLCWVLWASLAPAQDELPITDSDREHWSFAPLVAPTVPPIASPRALGPIDAFIARQLHTLELDIAEPARAETLLRRLHLDLTGLAPTDEDRARLAERASWPDAYEREVDRVLASPACGEHLAQSWLDLARYAETDGFEHDKVRPDAWRYRDWVIDAINCDLPYDRFVQQQVAGDLIDDRAGGAVATMFCLAGPDMPDLNDQEERRHNLLNEMTATVGSVVLGLQLGCAACHDHKYDPISQADFYRLRAVLATGVPTLVRDKPHYQLEEQTKWEEPKFFNRGDHRQPTTTLKRGLPRIVADDAHQAAMAAATHPRVQLAEWLTGNSNPLTARVMANRIWQSHFGRGLAMTPSDLGLAGLEPTHPELLDWLAAQLRDQSWSVQRLRRQIVLSAAYCSRSFADSTNLEDHAKRVQLDPDNLQISRYPRRRLTGEMVRDCMLQAAHQLNRVRGGEGVRPPLPPELVQTLLPNQWKVNSQPAEHARRSAYVFARRNLRYPIFEAFDRPDAGASCPARGQSITATQSLLLLNSELVNQLARAIAGHNGLIEDDARLADRLWLDVLGRAPVASEYGLLKRLLREFPDREEAVAAAALGLLNSNEFIFID